VLVPTYHCPTMVAPILQAGLQPAYFGIGHDGLPQLDALSIDPHQPPKAIIVAHYFGLPQSLRGVRAWCDEHRVALIEDCAHCFFGEAGERAVGAWGDYCTASASKFFPLPEAGLLGSNTINIPAPTLQSRTFAAQVKGVVDVLELGVRFGRLKGLNGLLQPVFRLKNRHHWPASIIDQNPGPPANAAEMMLGCDMGRTSQKPLWIARQLARRVDRGRIVAARQSNYRRFDAMFRQVPGARPLSPDRPEAVAPYVYPLWVDDADRVYRQLRLLEAPVFRWDRIWPGTPTLAGDVGPSWSRHVLQLLCHQDLCPADIDRVGQTILGLLNQEADPPLPRGSTA